MDLVTAVKSISEGKVPEGAMVVQTTHGSSEINLYGIKGKGFSVPVDKVEEFIEELKATCTDSRTLYKLGQEDTAVEIPGNRVDKVANYLRQARDIGVMLASYQQMF